MNNWSRHVRDAAKSLGLVIATVLGPLALPRPAAAYQQQIESAATRVGEAMTRAGRKTVAVVDFTDLQGNVTELGRFLAEQLSVSLGSRGGAFETIDRNHLRALLQEHKLSASGLIDPLTARKVGEIAGAECLVSGSVTPFSESVNLSIKLLDTGTAKILGGTTIDIPRTSTINELLAKGISEQQGSAGIPAGSSGSQSRSTSQSAPSTSQTREVSGFRFELRTCAVVGTTATCRLMITNTGEDRVLYLTRRGSRIIDPNGSEIQAAELALGDERFDDDSYAYSKTVAGIPLRAGVRFGGVIGNVDKAALLEFKLSSSNGDFTIQFRDVPLTR